MAASPVAPTLTEWLLALAPYIGIPLSFWAGILTSNHNLRLEAQKALREERKQKLETWRHGIHEFMGRNVAKGNSPYFAREAFAQTKTFLSLRNHLSDSLKNKVEAVHFKEVSLNEYLVVDYVPPINDIEVRDELLARIDELEKEWKLV